jgi:hypothetical protein
VTEFEWKPNIFLPVNLTVRFDTDVLKAEDPAAWCAQKARELLGPKARGKLLERFTWCLQEYAGHFRDAHAGQAAIYFYPSFTHLPPRAMSEIYIIGQNPETGEVTDLERARRMFAPDEHSFGDTQMTETEVPAGPALRIHRYRVPDPHQRNGLIMEEIAWVICPSGYKQSAMMITACADSAFSKVANKIADNMANNFRIEPIGAADNE